MPEAVEGTGESQPADDLRSVLASAVDASEKVEAPAPKPEKPEAEAPAAEVEAPEGESAGRERGPDGKFLKKEKPEGEEAEAKPEGEAKPEADTKPAALEPPAMWQPADKETFKKLPAEAQKLVLERHKAMEADYTRKTQAIAALKNEYEPVDKIFEPWREQMKQKGFSPRSLIEAWATTEKRLMTEPVEVIRGLVAGYKVDTAKLATALGIKAGAAPAAEGEQAAPDPQQQILDTVRNLLAQEIAPIKQTVSSLTETQRAAQETTKVASEARVMSQIEEFKGAKDEKGTLLHPHFEEIEADMARLAQAAVVAQQPVPPLKALYETAVWANTSTRDKLLTAREQHAEETRKADARAKAAQAKKAASSVTGAPGPGQASGQVRQADKSLREQLEEAAEEAAA